MTTNQQCKEAGLTGLAELSKLSNVPKRTLQDWHNKKPVLFNVIIKGSVVIKNESNLP